MIVDRCDLKPQTENMFKDQGNRDSGNFISEVSATPTKNRVQEVSSCLETSAFPKCEYLSAYKSGGTFGPIAVAASPRCFRGADRGKFQG
jgi:hypothetical protein